MGVMWVVPVLPVADDPISAIAEEVGKGECILFLGAGVHAPPPADAGYEYTDGERPRLGAAFSEHLAGESRFAERFPRDSLHNLQRVALSYELAHSRQKLVEEIRGAVQTGKRPSPALRGLAELPFPLIITTNYDKLFEYALIRAGKSPRVRVYSKSGSVRTDDLTDPSVEEPVVFKLHGDIDVPESIVITDEDYIHFVMRMGDQGDYHPVPETFRYRFKSWITLFVGYSLLDYNLRLLFKTLRWRMDASKFPPTYSVDPQPDQLIVSVWSGEQKYVRFIAQDVWTFVPRLYEALKASPMPR
jgi:hypothetical protein